MRPKINLLIVEPSDIVKEGILSLLKGCEEFNILPTLSNLANISERIIVYQPDILLINPTLIPRHNRNLLAQWQQSRLQMAIVALVYEYVEHTFLETFKAVVDIRMEGNKLPFLLRGTASSPEDEPIESYDLSERELDVLGLVAKGMSSKEIADKLNISIHTVNSHRKNITRKTGIKSPAGLAVYAMLNNLT